MPERGGDSIKNAKSIEFEPLRIVKVVRRFYDKEQGFKLREVGDELSVSRSRADKLISLGLAEKADAGAPEAAADKE